MTRKEEDIVQEMFVGSTHDYVLFVTDKGRLFRIKGYTIAEGSRTSKGTNIVNLLQDVYKRQVLGFDVDITLVVPSTPPHEVVLAQQYEANPASPQGNYEFTFENFIKGSLVLFILSRMAYGHLYTLGLSQSHNQDSFSSQ